MRRLWRFADERGFDWFSVSDHFQETPPQGGDVDCFESIATLSAAAGLAGTVQIGTVPSSYFGSMYSALSRKPER